MRGLLTSKQFTVGALIAGLLFGLVTDAVAASKPQICDMGAKNEAEWNSLFSQMAMTLADLARWKAWANLPGASGLDQALLYRIDQWAQGKKIEVFWPKDSEVYRQNQVLGTAQQWKQYKLRRAQAKRDTQWNRTWNELYELRAERNFMEALAQLVPTSPANGPLLDRVDTEAKGWGTYP